MSFRIAISPTIHQSVPVYSHAFKGITPVEITFSLHNLAHRAPILPDSPLV